MRLVESLKQSQQKLETMNAGFRERVESTFRQWPRAINRKFADMRSLSMHWLPQPALFDASNDEAALLAENSTLAAVHARLSAKLGEETFVGDWFTVDQACIDRFAEATGDRQWIHTEPLRAEQESPFRSTIAHGFLTLSLIPLLTDSIDPRSNLYPEARMVVNCGMNKVRFPHPVRSGRRVRARSRILQLVPARRSLEVVREVTIEIEHSNRPACVAEMVLRLYF